ncbi:MAG TPA: hypothetical protein VGL20_17575 [Candidatus Dormibacteraeota bacterium]|jgi:hypothetical protein
MAEMHDETTPRAPRRARTRRQQPATTAVNPTPVSDRAVAAEKAPAAVAVEHVAATPREVVSLYTALESASAEAEAKGHPLTLRRSGEGKYVATCSRCGMDLPVLDTARGWTYPSLGACPNPLRTES